MRPIAHCDAGIAPPRPRHAPGIADAGGALP